ncbi:MAG: hypothetical protein DRQ78_00180 [Epsilonproteobacteria bacterium]|nr:MAG: hypothetical protein DRQ78_00180 [Campylobacterota bacterium]
MESLKALTLGNYIRLRVRPNDILFAPLTTTFQDCKNIWNFLNSYEGMFKNTPALENVVPNEGLDGRSILIDLKASTGFFFNTEEGRPKTISESISELYRTIDTKLLESSVETEISSIKNTIGLSRFYDDIPSSDGSIDSDLEVINTKFTQLAADIFNRGTSIGDEQDELQYSFNKDALQTQATSLKDLIEILNDLHGGHGNLSHDFIASQSAWATTIPLSESVGGGLVKYTTVFASTEVYSDNPEEQKFYNPFDKDVKIKKIMAVVTDNTLPNTSSIALLISGQPSRFEIKMVSGEKGHLKNDVVEEILKPDDYIQFKIATGSSPTGQINISNLSMIIEETN